MSGIRLPEEEISSKELLDLSQLIQKEKLLFSRELEEYYVIEENEVEAFLQKELPENSYESNTVLGEVEQIKVRLIKHFYALDCHVFRNVNLHFDKKGLSIFFRTFTHAGGATLLLLLIILLASSSL